MTSTPVLDELESSVNDFMSDKSDQVYQVLVSPETYLSLCQETWEDYEVDDDPTIENREAFIGKYSYKADSRLAPGINVIVPEEGK